MLSPVKQFFLWKNVFLFHMIGKKNFAFLLIRKKYFDWGRFWKKNYKHNENPRPPQIRKWLLSYRSTFNQLKGYEEQQKNHYQFCLFLQNFSIGYWNYSDCVVFFCFPFFIPSLFFTIISDAFIHIHLNTNPFFLNLWQSLFKLN